MKRNLTKSLVILFIGALLGAGLVASLNAAQKDKYMTGYALWSKMDYNTKAAYLIGYDDAERLYSIALDGAKPLCGDTGKAWIEAFDQEYLVSNNMTMEQVKEGIDEFYKDWKNQNVYLVSAQNIVRRQIAGRPQAEIDEAIRKARTVASK